jgi:hypothetical protein
MKPDYPYKTLSEYMSATKVFFDWELNILKPLLVVSIGEVVHERVDLHLPSPEDAMRFARRRDAFIKGMKAVAQALKEE